MVLICQTNVIDNWSVMFLLLREFSMSDGSGLEGSLSFRAATVARGTARGSRNAFSERGELRRAVPCQ
jgi:hypothetical protein